jgi:CHAT domain-containing protein
LDLSGYLHYNAQFQKVIGNRDIQNRKFGDYLSVSHKLYDVLLKPLNLSAGTRVIISPDGSFLPFEALSSSPVIAEYLVHKYAFSYTYSASFLTKSRRSAYSGFRTKSFLGLAPVKFAPILSQVSLPGSDAVLQEIGDYFQFPKNLTGPAATRAAFTKESPDYRVVQLLTHATADSTGAVPTLYFADSTLQLNELSATGKSGTELLILSACRTGVGKNQRGEGIFSLARGFAGMGIPSTLTTLWSVENQAIYGLTKLFYAELDKGLPLDLALQNAQITWLKTASADNRLPYAWAGMVLVGNSEPLSKTIYQTLVYLILGSALAITAFAGYRLYRRRKAFIFKT